MDDCAYRLDQLGWLQFERLCSLVLEREVGLTGMEWRGRADEGRVALVDQKIEWQSVRLRGPVAVVVVWVRPRLTLRRSHLFAGVSAVASELGFWFDRVLVLTNLEADDAQCALVQQFEQVEQFAVVGAKELGESLDRDAQLRATMPSVLGLRDLDPLIGSEERERSSLDIGSAQALAQVFWPTRAYARARAVLDRHRFAVLTGPPEMGKTAIARMLSLAQLTDGWEAYECNSPEQVWTAFDPARCQVFVADDAFGSTEYRADAAEVWARELGRMLRVLDDRHWLIWTSRPAPLKAGLRRVQRERGSEHFPAPGEVLVDASDLDLAEKTLILFRHAKNRRAEEAATKVLRSAAVSIVEHPHFTPERIRRLVSERLGELLSTGDGEQRVIRLVERELAEPTEAMRTSFRALGDEHRELLIALLDAPAGLIDERELAAIVRRHHAGGLSRPPAELIDRLTDHFLRVTPLGIGWVHPSWRDLVIGELREDDAARRGFLAACGVYGVMLALSREGGVAGERTLPLLIADADWDALGDRMPELLRELEDHDLVRLLAALQETLSAGLAPAEEVEAQSLARYVLGAACRVWDKQPSVLPVFVLEAWYALNAIVPERAPEPPIGPTWTELHPPRRLLLDPITPRVLQQLDDWLALVQILLRYSDAFRGFRFDDEDQELLGHLAVGLLRHIAPDARPLAESVLARIRDLAPDYGYLIAKEAYRLEQRSSDDRWWVPHDISAPPSTEPAVQERAGFTREDVERVLNDL